ncbi:hypothetical protein [Methylobacterium sp. J-068]|uniref:hypothetical protein n=1 Tax=Methylobacterium sp. J-068 TaxID=2836649 RepID=UPI001FB8FBEE|nr:hypothetical protein [Methylobacterium sp. J-068]MCJ2034621.1 hypothetical protein [Methylobacterium sp. J-068]
MPLIEFGRLTRSPAALAAIIGATRALEMAFPVDLEEAVLNRLGRAVAALLKAEDVVALHGGPEAA